MNFKSVLFVIGMVGLAEQSYALEGGYTLIKTYQKKGTLSDFTLAKLYRGNQSGKCYYGATTYRRETLSEVDCRDHGFFFNKAEDSQNKLNQAALGYIYKNCAESKVGNEYPLSEPVGGWNGDYVRALEQGVKLDCILPDSFDIHLNERKEYERLKKKFGGM